MAERKKVVTFDGCRERNRAFWKNGESHYVSECNKRDKQTYTSVQGPRSEERDHLPSLSRSMEADSRAFAALMRHVKSLDAAERTVVMVQVENEPGSKKPLIIVAFVVPCAFLFSKSLYGVNQIFSDSIRLGRAFPDKSI